MDIGPKRLVRWAISIFSGRASSIVGVLVIYAILARVMAKAAFGDYLLMQSIAVAVGFLATGGLNRLVPRDIRRHLSLGEAGKASDIFGRGLVVGIPVLIATTLLTAVMLRFCGAAVGLVVDWKCSLLIAVYILLLSVHQFLAEVLRSLYQVAKASLFAGNTGGPIQIAITLAVFVFLKATIGKGRQLTLIEVMEVHILVLAVLTPILIRFCYAEFRKHGVHAKWDGDIRSTSLWYVSESPALAMSQFATYATSNMDVWIAGNVLPPESVAFYLAPRRLAFLVSSLLQVMNSLVTPIVPDLYAKEEIAKLQQVLRQTATVSAIPTVLISIPLLLAPEMVCTTAFDNTFAPSALPLFVLTLGQVVNSLSGSCGLTLMLTGHQQQALYVNLLCGAAMLAVVGFLGQLDLGPLAIVATLTTCLQFGLLWLAARHYVGVWTHPSTNVGEVMQFGRDLLARKTG